MHADEVPDLLGVCGAGRPSKVLQGEGKSYLPICGECFFGVRMVLLWCGVAKFASLNAHSQCIQSRNRTKRWGCGLDPGSAFHVVCTQCNVMFVSNYLNPTFDSSHNLLGVFSGSSLIATWISPNVPPCCTQVALGAFPIWRY